VGYDGEKLAYTGAAGLTVFGAEVGLDWLVGAAIALVVLGAVLYRVGARRRHRRASQHS
jgi:UPF0716 family protein affecting phage T7 exclusion